MCSCEIDTIRLSMWREHIPWINKCMCNFTSKRIWVLHYQFSFRYIGRIGRFIHSSEVPKHMDLKFEKWCYITFDSNKSYKESNTELVKNCLKITVTKQLLLWGQQLFYFIHTSRTLSATLRVFGCSNSKENTQDNIE